MSRLPVCSGQDAIRAFEKLGYRVDREEEFKGGFLVHMSKPVRS